MKENIHGFKKDGLPREVIVGHNCSYDDLVQQAASQLTLRAPDASYALSLFKASGVLIMDTTINNGPWTVDAYIKAQHKTAQTVKFGVGIVKRKKVKIV